MATNEYSYIYSRRNLNRIKHICKLVKDVAEYTGRERRAYNINHIDAIYVTSGYDLSGMTITNFPWNKTFLFDDHMYEVYEFKSKYSKGCKRDEGNFTIIMRDINTDTYFSGVLKVCREYIKTSSASKEEIIIKKGEFFLTDNFKYHGYNTWKQLGKTIIHRKPEICNHIFDLSDIRENTYNKRNKR